MSFKEDAVAPGRPLGGVPYVVLFFAGIWFSTVTALMLWIHPLICIGLMIGASLHDFAAGGVSVVSAMCWRRVPPFPVPTFIAAAALAGGPFKAFRQ